MVPDVMGSKLELIMNLTRGGKSKVMRHRRNSRQLKVYMLSLCVLYSLYCMILRLGQTVITPPFPIIPYDHCIHVCGVMTRDRVLWFLTMKATLTAFDTRPRLD